MKWRVIAWIMVISHSAWSQRTNEDYGVSPISQNAPGKSFRERLVFGGSIGASFGTFTFLQIAPQVGYRTTEKWINGVGVNYMYFGSGGSSQSIYGGSIWTRYFVFEGLFLSSEYELLNREVYDPLRGVFRKNVPVWMVGGGYFSGGRGLGVGLILMYDLIQDPWSPYQNPIIRGGIMAGF